MPLSLEGVTRYFPTFKPTAQQYENAVEGVNLHFLTYDNPEWNPHSLYFATRENNTTDWRGNLYDNKIDLPHRIMPIYTCCEPNEDDFLIALENNSMLSKIQYAQLFGAANGWKRAFPIEHNPMLMLLYIYYSKEMALHQ
jgi:hypothetical protein